MYDCITSEVALTQQSTEWDVSSYEIQWTSSTGDAPKNSFMTKEKQALDIYRKLNYNNTVILDIVNDILIACFSNSKSDIVISNTGDNELLIYRKVNGDYRNLIIYDDGSVAYMCIPADRRETFNEYYPFAMVNAENLASKL